MADQWYYGRDGQHAGPVTSQKLKELVDNGDLQPSDLIWKEGLSEWITAKKVKGGLLECGTPRHKDGVAAFHLDHKHCRRFLRKLRRTLQS